MAVKNTTAGSWKTTQPLTQAAAWRRFLSRTHSAGALAQLCFILHRSFFVVIVVLFLWHHTGAGRIVCSWLCLGGVYLQSRWCKVQAREGTLPRHAVKTELIAASFLYCHNELRLRRL